MIRSNDHKLSQKMSRTIGRSVPKVPSGDGRVPSSFGMEKLFVASLNLPFLKSALELSSEHQKKCLLESPDLSSAI